MSLDTQHSQLAGDSEGGSMDAGTLSSTQATARTVRADGRTPEEALEQAAVALCGLVADPASVEVREEVSVECDARDLDHLLADWLGAVLHNMVARRLRFRCFAVRLDGRRLFGHAFGEHVDPARHHGALGLRRMSFFRPTVRRSADGRWTAECEVQV